MNFIIYCNVFIQVKTHTTHKSSQNLYTQEKTLLTYGEHHDSYIIIYLHK